jgi:hypothetical protein
MVDHGLIAVDGDQLAAQRGKFRGDTQQQDAIGISISGDQLAKGHFDIGVGPLGWLQPVPMAME